MKKTLFIIFFILTLCFANVVSAYNLDTLVSSGIIQGDEYGFREDDTVTRGEFIKMINRTFAIPTDLTSIHLSDVPSYKWYFSDILTAVNYGYVKGDENGKMLPESNITRQEALTIAARLTGYRDIPATTYADDGYIATWAKGPATTLAEMGFIPKDDFLRPEELMTRRECFDLFYNILINRFASGDGSKASPYVIKHPYQLSNIRFYPDKNFTLANDIDFALYNLSYIPTDRFNGTLIGNGHKIKRLSLSLSSANVLFKETGADAHISGIKLICPEYAFSITTENNGTITDCYSTKKPEFSNTEDEVLYYEDNENFTEFSGGEGTASNPYIISTQENFKNINSYPDSYFSQEGNIIFTTVAIIDNFKGFYAGNGYRLSHLSLTEPNGSCAIFKTNEGTLENIRIYDGFFLSYENSASLCETNKGKIINCASYSSLSGNNCGGLVYLNEGEITNSFFEGKIDASYGAGLVHTNKGIISNSYTDADLFGKKSASLVYNNYGEISMCLATGSLNSAEISGLVFNNSGKITRSVYNTSKNSTLVDTGTTDAQYKENLNVVPFFNTDIWVSGKTSLTIKNNPSFLQNTKENTYSFAGGDGTASNPYVIITPIHLSNIRFFPFASFILKNDIDMSLTDFKAIKEFNGNLDGNSKKISGLKVPLVTVNNGTLQNLELKKSQAFTATNNGTIIACKNSSAITGANAFAFAEENNGSIIQCLNNGKLSGNKVASFTLVNNGSIIDCINTAELMGTGENSVIFGIASNGGILRGYNTGDMYFENSIGTIYPISDGKYTDAYYLNRYQSNQSGGIAYEGFNKKLFSNSIYSATKIGYPIFESVDFSDVSFPSGYADGEGTTDQPYRITSMKELFDIRMYPSAHFILTRDIDLSAEYNTPSIYNNAQQGFTPINNFSGTLDGNNSTIYALNILYSGTGDGSFILKNNGNIKNLTVAESRIEGLAKASAISITNEGKIENITLRGSRVGAKDGIASAIACTNEERGQILKCLNLSDIFASDLAGGICGYNYNYVADCTNNGGIIANSNDSNSIAGGICAYNHATVAKSVNNGKIFSYSDKKTAIAGGITGSEYQETTNCYNTGTISVKAPEKSYSGGIAGYCSDATISNCYNLGYITATSPLQYVGSIAGGGVSGKLSTCYFDHTLSSGAGEQCIKLNGVFPVSHEELSTFSVVSGLSEKLWEINNTTYPFPQLKTNPHKVLPNIENIRDFAGGNGSLENPYKIITKEHLSNVRKHLGSSFVLLADIDMTGESFLPVGDEVFSFFGTFLGNGHTISNLSTTSGMFRENHGEIYNLKLENISLTEDTSGGIASVNTGLIYRCSNTSFTPFNTYTSVSGGIAGINKHSGMIVSSYTNGMLGGNSHSAVSGGICGYNYGLIAGSYNGMQINFSVATSALLGGICGYNSGTISDCINYSDISAFNSLSAESNIGGIASGNNGSIVNSISSAEKLMGKKTGAICATMLNNNIYNCYYLNTVEEPFSLEGATGGSNFDLGNPAFYQNLDTATMWYLKEGFFPVLIETMF